MGTRTSFRNERFDILNLLRVSIFGNKAILEHDTTKTYTRGDLVYTYEEENHIVTVYKCIADSATGDINTTDWSSSFSGSFADAIAISKTEPTNHDTQIWFKELGRSYHNIP